MKDAEYYLKLNYPVTLQALSVEDGGGYAATIPLLGRNTFMAVGETTAEALTALEELRQVLIPYLVKQGTKLPEPETEEVIAQYSGSLMLRVPRNLHAQLASEAKRNGCSINKLATQLLAQGLAGPPTVANIQSIVADAVAEGMREALSRQNAGPVPSVFAARRWDIDEEELCLRPDDWADLTLLSDLPQRERAYEPAS